MSSLTGHKNRRKIRTSLACPYCNSQNIDAKRIYEQDHFTVSYLDEESTVGVYKKYYKCRCITCNRDYNVDYGYDNYTIFKKPINQASYIVDNELLARLKSESDRNYDILKGKLINGESLYFIIVEDDPYPIFIGTRKEDANKYIFDVKLTQKLISNTWMNRYK